MALFPSSSASRFDSSKKPGKSILKQSQANENETNVPERAGVGSQGMSEANANADGKPVSSEKGHISWSEDEAGHLINSHHAIPTRDTNKQAEAVVYKEAIVNDKQIQELFPPLIWQQHCDHIAEFLYQYYRRWYDGFLNRQHEFTHFKTSHKSRKFYRHHQVMEAIDIMRDPRNKNKGLAEEFDEKYKEKEKKQEELSSIDITNFLVFLREELQGDLRIKLLVCLISEDISKSIDWANTRMSQKVIDTVNKFVDELYQAIPSIPLQKTQLAQGILTLHAQQADECFEKTLYSLAFMLFFDPDQYTTYHELIKGKAKELLTDGHIQTCIKLSNCFSSAIIYLASQKVLFSKAIEDALKQKDERLNKALVAVEKGITTYCQYFPDFRDRANELYQQKLNDMLWSPCSQDYFARLKLQDNTPTAANIADIITPVLTDPLADFLRKKQCECYVVSTYQKELQRYIKRIDADIRGYIDKHDYWQSFQKTAADPAIIKNNIANAVKMKLDTVIKRKTQFSVFPSEKELTEIWQNLCNEKLQAYYNDYMYFKEVGSYIKHHRHWSLIKEDTDDVNVLKGKIANAAVNELKAFISSNPQASIEKQKAVWKAYCDEQLQSQYETCVRSMESSSKSKLASSSLRFNLVKNPVQQTIDDQQMPLSEVKDAKAVSEKTEVPSLT